MSVTPSTSKPVLDRRNSRSNVLASVPDSPPTKTSVLSASPSPSPAPQGGSGSGSGSGGKADRRLSASSATIAAVAAAAAAASAPGVSAAKGDSFCSIEIGPNPSFAIVKSATTKPPPTLYDALHALADSQKESLCVTENGKLIQTISTAQFAVCFAPVLSVCLCYVCVLWCCTSLIPSPLSFSFVMTGSVKVSPFIHFQCATPYVRYGRS